MRVRGFSALGLLVFAVVVHAGCGAPQCPQGWDGPYDNRDRMAFPHTDQDWICLKAPPALPDLGGYKEPDGATKHPNLVPRTAVFIESCIGDLLTSGFNINARIDAMYATSMASALERAISERMACFATKANGCDAVQECLGIAVLPHETAFATDCHGEIAHYRIGTKPDTIRDVFINCQGLDLRCYASPEPGCGAVSGECPEGPSCTMFDNVPLNCAYSSVEGKSIGYDHGNCSTFDLVCTIENSEARCVGKGGACTPGFMPSGNYFADFRSGIGCDDDTTLRACVAGHEQVVDCTTLATGFRCIGGSRPHCGLDFQCNYDGTNPLPTCDGSILNVCNAGVHESIDCKSLGFETCDPARGVCKPKPASG